MVFYLLYKYNPLFLISIKDITPILIVLHYSM
nr:MAG TPA: hypothetical protein [Caudoviricetes sp.]